MQDMFCTLTVTISDIWANGISENVFACIVLYSEGNGIVVPCHIHESSAELNVPSVCKYFHTCGMQSGL
jgi:hypothetical protein